MSVPRFFVDANAFPGTTVTLANETAHHVIHGLRLRTNEKLILINPDEKQYLCRILRIERRSVQVEVIEEVETVTESPVHIALGISLINTSKLDTIIRHVTELGVTEIIPFEAERSQLKRFHVEKRKKRWQEIVKSASQQSGRVRLPIVSDAISFEELLGKDYFDLKLISWEKEGNMSLGNIHRNFQDTNRIIVLIGPEGGFTEKEIEMTKKAGYLPFGLGPRILRCETAAIVSVALVQHYWGDLGIFS